MKKKRNTILFLLILCVIAGGGLVIQKVYFSKPGLIAVIWQNGSVVAELDLDQDTSLDLDDGSDGTNTVVIKDHTIAVTDANCPDLVCVHTGPISLTGEVIACLPHGLIITIEEKGTKTVDSAAW